MLHYSELTTLHYITTAINSTVLHCIILPMCTHSIALHCTALIYMTVSSLKCWAMFGGNGVLNSIERVGGQWWEIVGRAVEGRGGEELGGQ